MKELVLESSLLPIIESALATGSLLEMAKEISLYKSYLELISNISADETLSTTLLEIGNDYVPQQRKSVSSLL